MAELKFEILKHIEVLSESPKGWKKELNIVSWNNGKPKFDIREWSPDHDKMGKGVTLGYDEMELLLSALECEEIDELLGV